MQCTPRQEDENIIINELNQNKEMKSTTSSLFSSLMHVHLVDIF